jgi:hypothetical protein
MSFLSLLQHGFDESTLGRRGWSRALWLWHGFVQEIDKITKVLFIFFILIELISLLESSAIISAAAGASKSKSGFYLCSGCLTTLRPGAGQSHAHAPAGYMSQSQWQLAPWGTSTQNMLLSCPSCTPTWVLILFKLRELRNQVHPKLRVVLEP